MYIVKYNKEVDVVYNCWLITFKKGIKTLITHYLKKFDNILINHIYCIIIV